MRFFNRLNAKRQNKHQLQLAKSLRPQQPVNRARTATSAVHLESYEGNFGPQNFYPYAISGNGLSWPTKFLFITALILVATPEALAQALPPREDKKPDHNLNVKKDIKTYHGIPATDVSDLRLVCTPKSEGKGHEGKVCTMEGKTHHFKKPKNHNSHELLQQQFNSLFVKTNIDIVTPDSTFIHENGVFYLATQHVPGFTPGTRLLCFSDCDDLQFRQKAVDVIGENGIVKLMVAHTFLGDLHGENWGYDVNNNLVIVDLDHSPKTATEHFKLAIEKLQLTRHKHKYDHKFKHVGYPLTLNNVKAMRATYQRMLEQPLPHYHQAADLSLDAYKEVLNVYIKACDNLLARFTQQQPNYNLNAPSYEINKQLAQSIEAIITPRRTPLPKPVHASKPTTTKTPTVREVKTAPVAVNQPQTKPASYVYTPPPGNEEWERKVETHVRSLMDEKARAKQLDEKTKGRTDNWKLVWDSKFFHYLDLTADLIIANVINDYQGLYNGLVKIGFGGNSGMVKTLGGLCCLSGTVTAVEYAIKNLGITGTEIEGNQGLTTFHFAVLSGSIPAIERMLTIPNMDPLKLSTVLRSPLDYAIKAGSLPTVKRIAAIPGMLGVSKSALLEAASEGFIDAIIYLRELGFDPKQEIGSGKNIFDYERYWDRDSVEAIRKALTDPLPLPEPVKAPSLRL